MLIQEFHKDVPTKADGDGTMRMLPCLTHHTTTI